MGESSPKMKRRASRRAWGKWLTQGFALGPFAYQRRIERQLRSKMPFADFCEQINGQLFHLKHPLPPNIMAWLYDISLQTRLEKETMKLARRTLSARSWREGDARMVSLLELLRVYPTFDPERIWRRATGSRKDSRTAQRAAQLEQNLRGLSRQIRWWKSFAQWDSWQEHYRNYVVAVDRRLRNRLSLILKEKAQRAAVISAAMIAVGLKYEDSAEAISRMLRRQAGEKKLGPRRSPRKT